jgi:hypothetical protein
MTEMTDWAGGRECDKHDLAYCADCRDSAKIIRKLDGSLAYEGDCAVDTFREITGADYEEALEALRAAGYVPGRGTPAGGLTEALRSFGYSVTPTSVRIEDAIWMSETGRVYYVSGYKGKKGHAWSIIDGKANRPYYPPFRYQIYLVSA